MKPNTLTRSLRFILFMLFALSALPLSAEEQLEDIGSDEETVEIALLLKMVYIDLKERERKIVEVPLAAGEFESPEKGITTDRIAIFPGNPILHSRRPKDRRVQLFRGTDKKKRLLLGTLQIRYYAAKKNIWLPRFKVEQEIMVIPDGDDFIPISTIPGGEPMLLTGSAIPNAEGYYPRLKIGFGNKRFFLDSWVTQ